MDWMRTNEDFISIYYFLCDSVFFPLGTVKISLYGKMTQSSLINA